MSNITALPTPKKPSSPKQGSSRKTHRREAFHDGTPSDPTSPTRRSRMPKNAQRGPAKTHRIEYTTYLDAPTNHEDSEDPHELSFPSSHNPRASMVDNLAKSLDQFSSVGSGLGTVTIVPAHKINDSTSSRRSKGHVQSSSFSSDVDAHEPKPKAQTRAHPEPLQHIAQLQRRSSLRNQKNLNKLPSIFGEDEDSVRAKVYEAQRAELPMKTKPRVHAHGHGKSRSSSASSSVDLSHINKHQVRLEKAGKRRSRSFDFGSGYRMHHQYDFNRATEIAPASNIFSGRDSLNSPAQSSFPGPLPVRRDSTRSTKSAYGKKGKTINLGTGLPKSNRVEPSMFGGKGSIGGSETRTITASPLEPTQSVRPGFFRRVFGSSKPVTHAHPDPFVHLDNSPASTTQDQSSILEPEQQHSTTTTSKPQKTAIQDSGDTTSNKENTPVVAKKTSFFRRRKKSLPNAVPPPLPLIVGADIKQDVMRGNPTSPVSSLRAFMDPYLAGQPPSGANHDRNGSLQSYYASPTVPPSPFEHYKEQMGRSDSDTHGRTDSRGSSKVHHHTKQSSSLRMAHQDTFLADNSSTEDHARRTQIDTHPKSETRQSETKLKHQDQNSKPSGPTIFAKDLSVSQSQPLRPIERSHSWTSEKNAKLPQSQHTSPALSTQQRQRDENNMPGSNKTSPNLGVHGQDFKSAAASLSDASNYQSAPSTPLLVDRTEKEVKASPFVHVSHPSISMGNHDNDRKKARKIFDNADDELDQSVAAAWLGEAGTERERIRNFFMELFDFTHMNILSSLRNLCDRIVLKGETQVMDRLLDAFARRWCACNASHGFRSSDVVHTICYSILLLNTDLHLADIGQKMTRSQFVRNALPTIRRIANESNTNESIKAPSNPRLSTIFAGSGRSSPPVETDNASIGPGTRRPADKLTREMYAEGDSTNNTGGPLVDTKYNGPDRGWEVQVEGILKTFYNSISQEPLPLFGSQPSQTEPGIMQHPNNSHLNLNGATGLRRTPSTISKTPSDTRGRLTSEPRMFGSRFMTRAGRSRPRLPSAGGFGSSRTSLDEQSSAWSPSMSSTWSKASFGKTLTSMSIDSFGTEHTGPDYQSSIGFANALSQAIIRDDQVDVSVDESMKHTTLLEDESLGLCGAPWAKEGILKHKCHLEGVDKKSKDRNWTDCFAVVEKGYMRLFSFSANAKTVRNKARAQKPGGVVGGGNWQDNAEELWSFVLRHAIASALPPPGYSKTRPYVWALSLPTGAVHLFSVGTPDIVKEFVCTANYWSARLSKEPMVGGVGNIEYGWGDSIINRALIASESRTNLHSTTSPRPSIQLSTRGSVDQGAGMRPRLPGDRAYINEWNPPQQSIFASTLPEGEQFKALQTYVKNVEEELQKHNELRGPMLLAFSSKHANSTKAMSNWEKKSSYLLREIVKFRTYIDTLQSAQGTKDRIYKMRREEEEARQAEDDSRALNAR